MTLFTQTIIDQLINQYPKSGHLENQNVICKIFNPYGAGTWYCINMDPSDQDYIWGIAHLFEWEIGSVLRSSLETIRVSPFGLPLERDIHFEPMNAQQLWDRLMAGETI